MVHLTYAGGIYDRVMPLIDGSITVPRLNFHYVPMAASWSIMDKSLIHGDYDACEMGLSPFIRYFEEGNCALTLLPIFPLRVGGRHSALFVNRHSGIKEPRDLIGKRVGMAKYRMAAAIWFRGWLKDDYDVSPEKVNWFVKKKNFQDLKENDPILQRTSVSDIPEGSSIEGLLEQGKIDAAFLINKFPITKNITRLFEDYKGLETKYYRKAGLPINHAVALSKRVYESHPSVTKDLFKAFSDAKTAAYARMDNEFYSMLLWEDIELDWQRKILGEDHWSYGFKRNRQVLERFLDYSYEQGITSRKLGVEEIFADNTLET